MSDLISRKEYANRMKEIVNIYDDYLKVSKEFWVDLIHLIENSVDVDYITEQLENEKGNESDYISSDGKRLVRHWNLCVDNCNEIIKASVDKEQVKI